MTAPAEFCRRGPCPANYCDTGTQCCPDPRVPTVMAVPCKPYVVRTCPPGMRLDARGCVQDIAAGPPPFQRWIPAPVAELYAQHPGVFSFGAGALLVVVLLMVAKRFL